MPAVWNEDGSWIVPATIESGWRAIFAPVNGYLIVPSRFITWLALQISFEHYAAVSTALGVFAQALCVSAIAFSPTLLPFRLGMAIAVLLVPTDPECFVLPQYTFWWTTLLAVLAVFWTERHQLVRSVFVVLGGLSSPLIVAIAPILVLRAAIERSWGNAMAATVGIGAAATQYFLVRQSDYMPPLEWWRSDILVTAEKMGGMALNFPPGVAATLVGLTLAGFLVVSAVALPRKDLLAYLWLGAISRRINHCIGFKSADSRDSPVYGWSALLLLSLYICVVGPDLDCRPRAQKFLNGLGRRAFLHGRYGHFAFSTFSGRYRLVERCSA